MEQEARGETVNETLKPCPFCGSEAKLFLSSWYNCYGVYCTGEGCGVSFPYFRCKNNNELAKQNAVAAWNNRVEPKEVKQ
jgi:hypothetical protein